MRVTLPIGHHRHLRLQVRSMFPFKKCVGCNLLLTNIVLSYNCTLKFYFGHLRNRTLDCTMDYFCNREPRGRPLEVTHVILYYGPDIIQQYPAYPHRGRTSLIWDVFPSASTNICFQVDAPKDTCTCLLRLRGPSYNIHQFSSFSLNQHLFLC